MCKSKRLSIVLSVPLHFVGGSARVQLIKYNNENRHTRAYTCAYTRNVRLLSQVSEYGMRQTTSSSQGIIIHLNCQVQMTTDCTTLPAQPHPAMAQHYTRLHPEANCSPDYDYDNHRGLGCSHEKARAHTH